MLSEVPVLETPCSRTVFGSGGAAATGLKNKTFRESLCVKAWFAALQVLHTQIIILPTSKLQSKSLWLNFDKASKVTTGHGTLERRKRSTAAERKCCETNMRLSEMQT